ncbi:unnamed protein product [Echinostoma caproni]|uniref:C3H1-type domain-containing protein n=1 Tax=Echinostoma caproni TaxID=27848 RepID=A0A183AEV5_9TREM|nr:unnamed protein product [Echinostoma caproni]
MMMHMKSSLCRQFSNTISIFTQRYGKCQRRDPPCKYLHPPQHLREQLMQNGRNNMIIRNMQLQLFQHQLIAQSGMLPLTPSAVAAAAVVAAQAAAAASPGSAANSPVTGANGAPNSLLYPGPGPLAIGAPVPTSTYPFLNMGFAPYLNAITSTGLPTGTSTVALHLPGTEVLPPTEPNTSTTPAKRAALTDAKSGLPLYLPRTNGVHMANGTSGKMDTQDASSAAGGCMMVVNGGPMDSLTAAAAAAAGAAREMNGSPHSCPVTMRSSASTGTNLGAAAAAAATLYALQHPHGPPNAATLLNMHPTHPAAGHHPHPMASLQAAPLTAAMVNGNANGVAQAHFSTVPDPTGFFQPACE